MAVMRNTLLAAAAMLCACAALAPTAQAGIPIDTSVVLLFMTDVDGGDNSPCAQMTRRAMDISGRAVNFFVTGYYRTDGNNRMTELGYKESEWDRSFKPYTWDAAYRFSKGLADCMKVATANNYYIVTHIHLDDGDEKGSWRNSLIFDPSQKYGPLSYWEALVKPTALAIKDANFKKKAVHFSMQAEMGATLFYYPKAYKSMMGQIKNVIAQGGTPSSAIKVGVNVNWEKVCGCPANLLYSVNYYNDLQNQWNDVKNSINIPDVQALFRAIDWIGVSAYAGLPEYPASSDLELSLKKVDQELRLFGLDLRSLNKDLIFSEYGVGGGETGDYKTPARDARTAAAAPYWGVDGRYESWKDPWNRGDNRAFLRRFYDATVQFANADGGPTYKVKGIFLWSIISYDVTGVHYFSTGSTGSYRDSYISDELRTHNQGLRYSIGRRKL